MTPAALTLVVKVGGSLVSTKRTDDDLDLAAVAAYARVVADLHRRHTGRVVFVAGGGSIGHGAVRGIDPGDPWSAWRLTDATSRVRGAWVEALRARGVDAMSLQPSAWCVADDAREGAVHAEGHVLRRCLERGILPVLSGDAVLAPGGGLRVLGSDVMPLAVMDCVDGPWRILVLTSVDGYYEDAGLRRVVAHLTPDGAIARALRTSVDATDTSGGMAGKLRALAAFARRGAEGFILNGARCSDLAAWAGSEVAAWPRGIPFTAVSVDHPLGEPALPGREGTA
jgi:isopentenyl phosphate kinase